MQENQIDAPRIHAGGLVHLFGKGRNYSELSLLESLLFWIPLVCFLSAFHNSVETMAFLFISAWSFARFLDSVDLKQLSHLKKAGQVPVTLFRVGGWLLSLSFC